MKRVLLAIEASLLALAMIAQLLLAAIALLGRLS